MLREWAASKIGLDRLNYMNATGRIPRFANGGPIGDGIPTSGAFSAPHAMTASSPVTQTVYANFPGVQTAAEIERTLHNLASVPR